MAKKGNSAPRILVVDNDSDSAARIVTGYDERVRKGEKGPVPIFVDTVRASQVRLSDRTYNYLAVFVCPEIGSPAWVAVVRAAHKFRAGVPIFVIHSQKARLNLAEIQSLGIAGRHQKPITYEQILTLLGLLRKDESPKEEAPAPAPLPSLDRPAAEAATGKGPSDSEMMAIDFFTLPGRITSAFDIYIRMDSGRYVKVLNAGDVLTADRIEGYRKGGAVALHIRKAAQEAYLDFCDSIVEEALRDPNVPIQVKTSEVLAQGESTLRLLRDIGFTSRTIERVHLYVGNTVEMVKQISQQSQLIGELLFDIAAVEHAVGSTILAGLLIKHIGGMTESVFNGVGLACFLHDVSLLGRPPEMRDEDEAQMSPEQIPVFRQHPTESARMIARIPQIPKSVVLAVAQHHMRIDGSGFPALKPDEKVNRLSELIGISEDFLRIADRIRDVPDSNPVQALQAAAAGRYSHPILDAFVRAFTEK